MFVSNSKVDIDEKTGVLKRDGVESKMNPYDLSALEIALQLKEKLGSIPLPKRVMSLLVPFRNLDQCIETVPKLAQAKIAGRKVSSPHP